MAISYKGMACKHYRDTEAGYKKILRSTISCLNERINSAVVAYSAAVHILNKHVDERNSAILSAKSRLAPIKGMIIPRLELLAILTGVRAANKQLCYKAIECGKNPSGLMVEFEMRVTMDTESIEISTKIHTKPSRRNTKGKLISTCTN
uniref:Helo_like_N domain-containing protein n=1 Tax=Loa loa TaxID=7209 RepID=A0A1I7VFU2_LOALO